MERRCQVPRRTILEGVGQVQLQKGDEIGKHPRVTPRRIQGELVKVKYKALHVLHVVIGLAAYLAYLIVRHINHPQIRQTVQGAEYIPRQLFQLVPRKDKNLSVSKHYRVTRDVTE